MKTFKMLFAVVVVVIVIVPCPSKAADITFTSNGTINSTDVWDLVKVENDGTVVNMFGGQVGTLWMYDASTFNMSGGQILHNIMINHRSTMNISAGMVYISDSDFVVYGEGIANFNGGTITAGRLKTYPGAFGNPDSIVNINGGSLNFNTVDIHGILNLREGFFNAEDSYIGTNDAILNIYGYGFNYSPTGGFGGEGKLIGYLLDDKPFTFDGVSQSEYARFNLLPEPATIFLIGIGGLFLRRNCKK